MNTNQNIADYYNQTLNHYQNWWKLDNNLCVHYGIWDKTTRNFQESLLNTNKVIAKIANISTGEMILDAGCGVGGSAFFLAENFNANVKAITLSEKQYMYALKSKERKNNPSIDFSIQDYCNTNFAANTFDHIWAIESITSAPDKDSFAKEAFRVLKPGGSLIIADYFRSENIKNDPHQLLEKWRNLWSMAPFLTKDNYWNIFKKNNFELITANDVTTGILPTAKRMYWSYLLGSPFAVIYNIFNTPTPFAKNHYKSGLYQYKALKHKLWKYYILVMIKN